MPSRAEDAIAGRSSYTLSLLQHQPASLLLWLKLETIASMLANCQGHLLLYRNGL